MADQSASLDQPDREGRPRDPFTITRPDQLQALGEPTRWRILGRLLEGPASIQELARSLGAPKGTISHHVRVLDRAGLIRLVEERRVRGVIEKRYARVGRQFRLPERETALATEHPEIGTLPLRQAIAEASPTSGPGDPSMSFVMRARMPAARAQRFAKLLNELAAEFSDGGPGEGETFGFVAGIYRPDWAGNQGES
jgi:DNA-binding transcriptional ArsR family regulator